MVKKLLLVAVLVSGVLGMPRAVLASDDFEVDPDACATNLLDCYNAAAKVDGFWYRWAAGLDCELKFTKCVRTDVLGR